MTVEESVNINDRLSIIEELAKKIIIENEIMKTILLDVFKNHVVCSLCEAKGQNLPECKCMKNQECLNHIIELYGDTK